MPPICTHFSRVNPWECDENEHMNARFYADRFQQAAANFSIAAGIVHPSNWKQRLGLRFYSEAQVKQHLLVESAILEGYPHGRAVGHHLLDASSSKLLAAAIDQSPWQSNKQSIPSRPFDPRLDYSDETPNTISAPETEQEALMDDGFSSGDITIGPADVDAEGACLNQVYVGLFSDGAATAWKTMGLSRNVLKFNRWGCMVVNLSMIILKPSQPGDVVKQISRIIKLRSRTVTMRHDQFNAETGEPIAYSLATGMLVNLNTRRAIHFPQHVLSS